MSGKRMTARAKAVVMILSGIMAGSLLGGPAAAHVGKKVGHLVNRHLVSFFYTQPQSDSRFINSNEKASDSDLLDGINSTGFLPVAGKAADAELLDGINSTGFLPVAGKAADSNLLDNIDSASFVQFGSTLSGVASCPGAGFDPENGATAYTTNGSGLRTGAADTYRCAIDLPNGATVSSVTFTVSDPTPVGGVTLCTLTRTDLSPPIATEAATGPVAGPVGTTAIGDTAITAPLVAGNTVIANSSFGYSLQCTLDATAGIYGAVVTYSVPASAG